jgi:hypothetical protein
MRRSHLGVYLALVAIAGLASELVQAKDYCCVCRGQSTGKAVDADDDFSATLECSMICKRPTKPKDGACEVAAAPPTPAAPPAAAATPGPAMGRVLLFKSEDCSGDAVAVTQSTGQLSGAMAGMRSFSVESGGPAAVFEKPDFGGARTERVGPSICVSPGWEIVGVRIGAN